MSLLQVESHSPALFHLAAATVLYLHIGAGGISLVSGAAALMARKGSRVHRVAGKVFVASMLIMAVIGACVAPFLPLPERATTLAGILTFYLAVTGYTAMRPQQASDRLMHFASLLVALGILGVAGMLLNMAMASPAGTLDNQPPQSFYLFIVIGTLASAGDALLLIKGVYSRHMRLARHLWRMCAALFIAAGSLFLGQPQVFPEFLRGSVWLMLPVLAVLLALAYWLGHTLFLALRRRPPVAAPIHGRSATAISST